MSENAKCQIIVPVENGFVVMPYTLNTMFSMSEAGQMVSVAHTAEELGQLIADMYSPPPDPA